MNRLLVLASAALVSCIPAGMSAQGRVPPRHVPKRHVGRNMPESFSSFRDSVHKEYMGFRNAVLENYATFLAGEWVPFVTQVVERPHVEPKPSVAPVRDPGIPAPEIPAAPIPIAPAMRPDAPVTAAVPSGGPAPKPTAEPWAPEPSPLDIPDYKPAVPGTAAADLVTPIGTIRPALPDAGGPVDMIEFYGMDIPVERHPFAIDPEVRTTGDMARHWKQLDSDPEARGAAAALASRSLAMGLNGYLTYELACAYARQLFPDACAASRMSLVHYLMANLGYDVRLGQCGSETMLLMPFDCTVYARPFITLDGRNYTLFFDADSNPSIAGQPIYTANLPKGEDTGRVSDLRLQGLNLPERTVEYHVQAGPLDLRGTMNGNIFPVVYRYPQMPTEGYASSTLLPEVRRDLVAQVRRQMEGAEGRDAVNGLLKFFHEGFPYATDDEFHGFEKPYFVEETLFYPKCDCEDRAIMMTYLLWEALGMENVMIAYPDHEAAAVSLPEGLPGTYYTAGGRTYYVCDPTYIGSKVGECMPRYSGTAPVIDKTYPD